MCQNNHAEFKIDLFYYLKYPDQAYGIRYKVMYTFVHLCKCESNTTYISHILMQLALDFKMHQYPSLKSVPNFKRPIYWPFVSTPLYVSS